MSKKEIDIDFVEKMALKTLHPEILRDAKVFASGNVLYGKYDQIDRFQIARHNFLYGAIAAKALDKKIKEKAEKRKLDFGKDPKPLSINGVVNRQGTVNLKPIEKIQERINLLVKLKKEFEEYNQSKNTETKQVELLEARLKELEWVLN